MDLGIKGKSALVTGAGRGIGRAIALALAKEGCHVAICARTAGDVSRTAADICSVGVEGKGIVADATDPAAPKRVIAELAASFGRLHILVNNLGGGGRWGGHFSDTADETWLEVYQKNVMAAVRFTRLAMPFMLKEKWGRVVAITSIYGREAGPPGEIRPWYAAAKTAETSLIKTLAMDPNLVRKNITFNSVAPGLVLSPDTALAEDYERNSDAWRETLNRDYPLGRFGTPEEVADAVVFLCSERAGLINGVSLAVDGGQGRSYL